MRRVFRIEPFNRLSSGQAAAMDDRQMRTELLDDGDRAPCADEIIAEVHAVRASLEGPAQEARKVIARLQGQIQEFEKLKAEFDLIEGVISQTRRDVDAIPVSGFEGLTGERVAKLVTALNFVDQHVARMTAIWDDIAAVSETAQTPVAQGSDPVLLDVPKLNGEAGHVSPDDIDALCD